MNCSVPANQPIYQALLDKAASYPADKPYQAKAYKKAAETIATYTKNIYDDLILGAWYGLDGIGDKIEDFINDFIKANPQPATYAEKAMDEARKIAAQNAPTITIDQLRTALGLDTKPARAWFDYLESKKPVVYTAENPRRSKRVAAKPKVEYFTKQDEQDEIAEAIEAVCAKKGWVYSEDLVADFEAWLPTADKYTLEKYDYKTDKYIPRSKAEAAKEWAMYYSKNIEEQKKKQKFSKNIIKYCEKNGIEYQDVMAEKFAAWKADPANKNLVNYTYTSYNYGGCTCSGCDPTGEKKKAAAEVKTETSYYERTPAYCVKAWFSTLKKTIAW
jgi:hypothetical protein